MGPRGPNGAKIDYQRPNQFYSSSLVLMRQDVVVEQTRCKGHESVGVEDSQASGGMGSRVTKQDSGTIQPSLHG